MLFEGRDWAALGFVVTVGVCLWTASFLQDPAWSDPVTWQVLFDGMGVWRHVGYLFLQVMQVVIPFIPGQATSVAAGYLFGPWLGLVYALLGAVVGGVIAFWLSRWLGRGVVVRLADPSTVSMWNERVETYGGSVFFLLVLLPFFPDDLLCFVAGLSNMRFGTFLAGTIFGRLPPYVFYAFLGSHPELLWSWTGAVLVVLLSAVSIAGFYWRDTLFAQVVRLATWLRR